MGKRDPRVDAYVAKAADFAQPILNQIRDTVHAACPEVEEDMKWSFPHFIYKGMLCSMAAFKEHAAFGFWKGSLILGRGNDMDAMGQFGRLTAVSDLPARNVLIGFVKQAAALNDQGVKVARPPKRAAPKTLRVPADLAGALKKNKKAQAAFDDFPPSHKRDYIVWITEAKAAETRARRLQQSIAWIGEGKSRNWKYEKKNSD